MCLDVWQIWLRSCAVPAAIGFIVAALLAAAKG
jgi:hypothetical protein